ncbi:MAG: DNA methyltransferase [Candidatus Hodarchaeota archaeon]
MEEIFGPIIETQRPPRYRTHLYWTRKPPDLAVKFIMTLTSPGEIVLDPFCGSGVVPIEAARFGRIGIGFDIDPVGLFIARMTSTRTNLPRIKRVFESFLRGIGSQVQQLYKTSCSVCFSKKAITRVAVWLHEAHLPKEIRGKCPECGAFSKQPDKQDQALLIRINKQTHSPFIPRNQLRYENGNLFLKGERHISIADLYTPRNLLALGIIREQISKIRKNKDRDILTFAFSSIVHLASKLTPDRKSRPFSSHWGRMSYWIPPRSQERNVLELFQNALLGRQGVFKGLKDSRQSLKNTKIVSSFDKAEQGSILLKQASVLHLSRDLPPSRVDLVFTDPPYGGAVQHHELNSLWAAWLGLERDPEEEITINPRQEKTHETFGRMIRAAFREIAKILKPGKNMILTFHSTDLRVWKLLVQGAIAAGFDLEQLFHQPSRRISFKALAQPLNAAIGDYVFLFRHSEQEKEMIPARAKPAPSFSEIVREAAIRVIAGLERPCTFTELLTRIYPEITKSEEFFSDNVGNLHSLLKIWLGKGLWLVRARDPIGRKEASLWWVEEEYEEKNKSVK